MELKVIAALFVDKTGTYADLDSVEIWDEARDARLYRGPHRVVAHPPCQRWGKFWHGSTAKPHQFRLGEDGGKDKTKIRNATPREFRDVLVSMIR